MKKQDIERKIDEMSSLEDKAILKELLQQVLGDMLQYQEEQYSNIRKSLLDELTIKENEYALHVGIIDKSNYQDGVSWMYPVIEEERMVQIVDYSTVKMALQADIEVKVGTVFAKLALNKIDDWRKHIPEFTGKIITSNGKIRAVFRLEYNDMYEEAIANVKEQFERNCLVWKGIPMAYSKRFFDVILVTTEFLIQNDETIINIVPDFKEYQDSLMQNQMMLWNMRTIGKKIMGFPVPLKNHQKYKFTLELLENEKNCIVELKEDEYVVHKEKGIEIFSEDSNMREWRCSVVEKEKIQVLQLSAPSLTNKRKDDFCDRHIGNNVQNIKTKAEMIRMISSLQVEAYIELIDIRVLYELPENQKYYYSENYDNKIKGREILLLIFRGTEYEGWIAEDILLYVLENMQMKYYEFQVVGVLN